MKKYAKIIIPIVITIGVLAGGYLLFKSSNGESAQSVNNVEIIDGKQIITIKAKGGYSPRSTTAQAGIPTIVKVVTNSTFDCSSALVIPSLNYRTNLPPSGATEVDLAVQESGTKLQGVCAMGMYNFTINFD